MSRHFPFPMNPYSVLSMIFLLTSMICLSRAVICRRRLVRIALIREGCLPKVTLAFACGGACTSYTHPSPETPTELLQFCQCCDAYDFQERSLLIECWEGETFSIPRDIRVTLNMPQSCMCRPCSDMPENIVPADDFWNRGKRNVPFLTVNYMYEHSINNQTYSNRTEGVNEGFVDDKDIQVSVEPVYDLDSVQ